tara:strand:+ start:661 stop:1068 length:408 start_codon:yes stop_codon:yes gene_type:complete
MSFKLERNFNNNVPSWEAILNNFNWSSIANKDTKHICPGFFVSHEAHLMKEVQTSLEKLDCKIAHLYFNIAIGKTYGKHKDDVDVYFWQVQGAAKWSIKDQNIILNPGDLLIIEKDVYHEVVPLTPRAGISMSKI